MKHAKSSYSKYLKKLRTAYPNNASTRNPIMYRDQLTHREFKLVLPPVLKDTISGKGSSLQPGKNMFWMIMFHE